MKIKDSEVVKIKIDSSTKNNIVNIPKVEYLTELTDVDLYFIVIDKFKKYKYISIDYRILINEKLIKIFTIHKYNVIIYCNGFIPEWMNAYKNNLYFITNNKDKYNLYKNDYNIIYKPSLTFKQNLQLKWFMFKSKLQGYYYFTKIFR